MPAIDDLAAAVTAALDRLQTIATRLHAARQIADELAAEYRRLGAEDRVRDATAIAAAVEAQQAQVSAISHQGERVLAQVEALRGTRNGNARGTLQGPPSDGRPPMPPWSDRPAVKGFTHQKPIRECVDAVRREGWPSNAQGRISARGFLYSDDGRQVNTETFHPHRPGRAPPCEDLKEPWRSDEHYTTTWHAERDAAALIREHRITKAVLYLNVPTCGKETGDPHRCDANLEKILPADTELYVWTIHKEGSRSRRRYVGTGEAIDD